MASAKSLVSPKNALTFAQSYKLANLIQADYAARRLHDTEFAAAASTELGFTVTEANVAGIRKSFDIPSTREALIKLVPSAPLEQRVAKLEAWIAKHFPETL